MNTPAGRADPYPLYARAHGLGAATPVTDSMVLVTGHSAVNRVLRSPDFGSSATRSGPRSWASSPKPTR
ncbi:hypothetical protein GXW83_08700 [Streptacidiphilus sp. PB12-B1b]|uniref:hypothetical protein n=1 Tax=Streptacidiphilus sp. PB12-B1b TaxID=2705012 RepID=UPI0015F8A905|nr:hypothetical protein [Streptacidiphilus sp. PB12-B1b]QMU75808.1 hypothetical protein GXW83_08700 [Streptacidiphilus sp. PB12-B1b]